MSPALVADVLLLIIAALALRGGWRQGALASVLSSIGIVAGLIIGLAVAPPLMGITSSVALRFLLGLAVVVLLVGVGNLVGALLGAGLRDRMRLRSSQTLDSFLGAGFQLVAVTIVCWLVAAPIVTGAGGVVAQGLRDSRVMHGVQSIAPDIAESVPARVSAMLSESGLPPLVSPFYRASVEGVAAPALQVEDRALVENSRPSIIHVMGASSSCQRRLMGSGFVTADDYVITNAHVVAGTSSVNLDTKLGMKSADVVYFNPRIDVAVLHSEDLGLPVLDWAEGEAVSGDDAVVMGYPKSGPFEAAPARIAERITIAGTDIYARGRVEREAYTVRGNIREGNSGGPVLNEAGDVVGLVFGASRDQAEIGFALTAQEVLSHVGDVESLVDTVPTGGCVG